MAAIAWHGRAMDKSKEYMLLKKYSRVVLLWQENLGKILRAVSKEIKTLILQQISCIIKKQKLIKRAKEIGKLLGRTFIY